MSALQGVASECRYGQGALMYDDLATVVAGQLAAGIASRGRASLVVSGGSTPGPLFDRLAQCPIDWAHVDVTLADERWVPADHKDSNELLVRQRLLTGIAENASFTSLFEPQSKAIDAVAAVSARVRQMAQPFDVVLLGMGGDGHTASFFPGDPGLAAALHTKEEVCQAMLPPADPRGRMTLTLRALLNSRRIALLITGDEKWRLYRQITQYSGDDAAQRWPVSALLSQRLTPVSVWWGP